VSLRQLHIPFQRTNRPNEQQQHTVTGLHGVADITGVMEFRNGAATSSGTLLPTADGAIYWTTFTHPEGANSFRSIRRI
jgi:hypothetical protein